MNNTIKKHCKNLSVTWLCLFLLSFMTINVVFAPLAQANDNTAKLQGSQNGYSEAELAQMLAPIALYPDSLLTHILIAATYPLEIVQARRWLTEHSENYSTDEFVLKAASEDWDASVKALLPFANVLTRLNDDLSWTEQLGNAFLLDEAAVLQSIQALRKQAQVAGNLADIENMQVSYDNNAIIIEPIRPEIVYIPYYDARVVYGNWHWRHYPPVYWSVPHYARVNYYNSAYGNTYYQPFYWHTGVRITTQLFFGAVHWHNRHVVVIKPTRRYSHNPRYYNRKKIITSHSAKRWQHKPHHRRGVSYKSQHVDKQFSRKLTRKSHDYLTNKLQKKGSYKNRSKGLYTAENRRNDGRISTSSNSYSKVNNQRLKQRDEKRTTITAERKTRLNNAPSNKVRTTKAKQKNRHSEQRLANNSHVNRSKSSRQPRNNRQSMANKSEH